MNGNTILKIKITLAMFVVFQYFLSKVHFTLV